MPKPWGRYELGFIDHDKFRAINVNALGLWWEGKNYCDSRHTDGLIPLATARLFRFYSLKAVALLTKSAGPKPGTAVQYAPLWERLDGFGFKMHDYLDHNDPRDVVIARIEKKTADEVRRRKNQAAYRDRMKAERSGHVTDNAADNDPITNR